MRPEHANTAEIEFYTPKEFRALLEASDGPMRALISIGGLAGLRTAELLRGMRRQVRLLDNSELMKAEGALTCCSLVFRT